MPKATLSAIRCMMYPKDFCIKTSHLSQEAKFNPTYQRNKNQNFDKQAAGHNFIIQNQSPEPNIRTKGDRNTILCPL